ncbi:MAG: hypothetical protein RIQ53_745 [Pseudomonadota bacterium]|jgi:NADPH-dependent 2,4-dienoyl-CoA reductase/sulfur reductase-like enzyme
MSPAPRIVIVGTGPAGVRAAEAVVEAGLRPVVVDESPRDGGQIYRRQPEGFRRPAVKLYGPEAPKAVALHQRFDALRPHIDHRAGALVWNLTPGALHLVHEGRAETLAFDALLLATGATDRLMPVPGWQQAGCYTLGAAQIALKAQACAVGRQVVFMGSGPLLYLVASQYLQAGAAAGVRVAAVLDTAPPLQAADAWDALPGLLARPGLLWRGLGLQAQLRRTGVPLMLGVSPLRIEGDATAGVQAVVVHDARGRERRFAADACALGWHLRPETQLADLAGCRSVLDAHSRQWLPALDADGRSSVPGVYLAGDGARLQGADAAETGGRLAALALLADQGHAVARSRLDTEGPALRARMARMERFRQGLARAFPWPHEAAARLPDDTVVCRCEAVTAGELRQTVRAQHSQEINRSKAFCRVGMGRCQGRYCGHAGAEIVAACAGLPLQAVGRLRAQAPVKPLLMDTPEATP